jgi:signal transduction histidine kinase
MAFPRLTAARAYVFALAAVATCAVVRWLLSPLLEDHGLYLVFMIPVAAAAYLGGPGPGFVSAGLSAAVASPLFLNPSGLDGRVLVHLVLFGFESAAVILLIDRLQRARREAEAATRAAGQARTLAEGANRAKEQVVARISHEWRGPLNTITGWVWQIENRPGDQAVIARATTGIKQAVEAQSRLVSDLLDCSRGWRGKLSIDLRQVAIVDPVRRAIEAATPDANDKRITMHVFERGGDAQVRGDPMRLEQVFTNLLLNAVKFTPAGGAIAVSFATLDDRVEAMVSDSGVGISPAALEEIFEPFAQFDEHSELQRGGLGLGLSIARDIVRLHHGSLTASSPGLGMGSSFVVRLPRAATGQSTAATCSSLRMPMAGND